MVRFIAVIVAVVLVSAIAFAIRKSKSRSKNVMLVSYAAGVVFLGLALLPDPKIIGIHAEPSRILFYFLSAALAVLSFAIAMISTTIFTVRKLKEGSRK